MLIGNNVFNNALGISSYQTGRNTFKNNIINSNYGDGILFRSCVGCTLINNIANSNYGDGIFIYYYSSENNLTNNTVNFNRRNGIVLGYVDSNNTLLGNNASNNNNSGIYVAYSGGNNMVIGNTASNNSYGIYLQSSSNNIIYNNIFNNTNNAFDNRNNTWNITKTAGINIIGGPWLGGNYWSDYAGEDLDGDGLGDTMIPYNSSGNITNGGDFLPLIIPTKPTAGSISGFKINDTNSNGVWNTGEMGIENWNIRLIGITGKGNDTEVIRKETFTNALGFYKFDNLPAGRYSVIEERKKGFVPTSSPVKSIKLAQDENFMNNNFTNRPVNRRD